MSLKLLELEMETLWGDDLFGRDLRPHPLVAIAVAEDGQTLRFRPSLPDDCKQSFTKALAQPFDPRQVLEQFAPLQHEGGPSYVFSGFPSVSYLSRLGILTSNSDANGLGPTRPELWGGPAEWSDLLAGKLGPWAMGVVDGRVASVCYTPVASSSAAEAGIWTDPQDRGNGWAAIVADAWARAARGRFETLFYSTSWSNTSSQAVAKKLGLESIGSIWQIWEAGV